MIEIYALDGSIDLTEWLKYIEPHEVSVWAESREERAVWTGNPFILAGNHRSLQKWFAGLDSASIRVIGDHAYFWVLTSSTGFRHNLIPQDRLTVLNWAKREHNVIHEAMEMLGRFPKLSGLSKEMHHLREEILRIGVGHQEPATPVLIYGESGSGKEGTAQSLFEACDRSPKHRLYPMGGAWLGGDSIMTLSEVFGIEKRVATEVDARPGLVELHSDGALFIDDFDTAPKALQEQLLRITSTPKGSSALYRRVGGKEDLFTNVWLIFATNHDIAEMLKSHTLRLDFLFRFEDRVIVIPPLRNRPADLPAIAQALWRSLTAAAGPALEDRVLSWRTTRDLQSREQLQWKGNVRELAALLSLVVSMCKMPKHRHQSTGALINQVLARGPSYFQWLRILTEKEFTAGPSAPDRVGQILASDPDPVGDELSSCEIEIRNRLGESGWNEFVAAVQRRFRRDEKAIRRILCRYQVYALRYGPTLSKDEALRLSGARKLHSTQALNHLKWLSEADRYLQPVTRIAGSNSKWIYGPGTLYS